MNMNSRRRMPEWKFKLAKDMRINPTKAEHLLWGKLKNKSTGVKWRRQSPLFGYIADFWCPQHRLVVEVDGPIHEKIKDDLRDQRLLEHGIVTLRFTNDQIFNQMSKVVEKIVDFCS